MRIGTRRTIVGLAALGLTAVGLLPATSASGCAGPAAGGEWRSYGGDVGNSRRQWAETRISPSTAKALRPAYVASVATWGGEGEINHTPVIADGCLYLASTAGNVFAANADTGALMWKVDLEESVQSTPTVVGGLVFVSVNRGDFPYVVALDQATGAERWRTTIDKQSGSDLFSSPTPFDGMLLVGVSGAAAESGTTATGNPQSRLHFRGTYLFLDQATGAILHKEWVIPDGEFADGRADGYSGGGIWSTFAVDQQERYAYVGAGNPFTAIEHPNTNAILKIDADRRRPTFGRIVGAYHGRFDQYLDALSSKPVCKIYIDVFTCELMDYDFGSSPQLFTDAAGRKMVGAQQKSGVYHAAERATMRGAWSTVVGGPFGMLGGMGTASWDGQSLFVGGSFPGIMNGLDATTGKRKWLAPMADGIHYQSTTSANGVVYGTDTNGVLRAWGGATGRVILTRVLFRDSGGAPGPGLQGAGIAVARSTVYVPAAGGFLVAYR